MKSMVTDAAQLVEIMAAAMITRLATSTVLRPI